MYKSYMARIFAAVRQAVKNAPRRPGAGTMHEHELQAHLSCRKFRRYRQAFGTGVLPRRAEAQGDRVFRVGYSRGARLLRSAFTGGEEIDGSRAGNPAPSRGAAGGEAARFVLCGDSSAQGQTTGSVSRIAGADRGRAAQPGSRDIG